MDARRQLQLMLESDRNFHKIASIRSVPLRTDANHLERRQHQRGINNSMIAVALLYGQQQFSHGALIFTITDRILRGTPYSKLLDWLRGLRVVCLQGPPDAKVLTAYWHKKTKSRVRR
ncbi:hypothetical protein [Geitlerinema sp. PCC 9228]|jgi:hypothetical protein|uniref:hypothetical protein n=1 Tax=Geitlerinema sp. PCC 9228 TaxID=111611 RepID=UPI0008F9DB03|nr:hypothetical protein [Geitlerinema sp. PCC 9228]